MASQEQPLHTAKDYRHFVYEGLSFATRRGQELSHEFMRLEVQVAAMLFAFSGLLLGYLASVPSIWMRGAYALALFLLIASIAAGLFHIKRQEQAWDEVIKDRKLRFNHWQDTVNRNGNLEEARAYDMGISKGITEVTSAPLWSWVLQSVFLGTAILLLFGIAIAFLFSI